MQKSKKKGQKAAAPAVPPPAIIERAAQSTHKEANKKDVKTPAPEKQSASNPPVKKAPEPLFTLRRYTNAEEYYAFRAATLNYFHIMLSTPARIEKHPRARVLTAAKFCLAANGRNGGRVDLIMSETYAVTLAFDALCPVMLTDDWLGGPGATPLPGALLQPGTTLVFTVDRLMPNIIYYQTLEQENLGGPLIVCPRYRVTSSRSSTSCSRSGSGSNSDSDTDTFG